MNNLKDGLFTVGTGYETAFRCEAGVYQDGTVPFFRDSDGILWAMAGHSHLGHIGVFCGTALSYMREVYPAALKFGTGAAGDAFNGIPYPEGIRSRGSVWPFGLYICPGTGRFFCFFHNETGWNGQGTAYDAQGLCETPRADSDFRHIGLMHSDDRGKNWVFDRWVLTADAVCFTELYRPDNALAIGQPAGVITLGSGDFSLFPADDGWLYLFYSIITLDTNTWKWLACDAYVARTRQRTDGVLGDFVKFYNGSFSEAGNLGRETPVARNAWHPRVAQWDSAGGYVMASAPICRDADRPVADYMELRTSPDLLTWSEPISVDKDGRLFGNHYNAAISLGARGNPYRISGNRFTVLTGHNATDVSAFDLTLTGK